MSDRKEKLHRLLQSTTRRIVAGSPAAPPASPSPVRTAASFPLPDIPLRESRFPSTHLFGAYPVGRARPLHRHLLWLAGLPHDIISPEGDLLFLDTE
ncbi:MAG: hypothetical protein JXQ27_14900, partial [Acidobacteria bacterium]|nr:hypothetical protein [Acidobacteriota bacterium]